MLKIEIIAANLIVLNARRFKANQVLASVISHIDTSSIPVRLSMT